MNESMVMTLIGKDRPGLVEPLAQIIEAHGGNWEESRMVQLAGEFAGLLRISVPSRRAAALEQALAGLPGVSMVVARVPEPESAADDSGRRFSWDEARDTVLDLEVVGQDHPGIVRQLSAALSARGINVEELETEVASAPMSGEQLFRARARLQAPAGLDLGQLADDLERLAADLMVEITLADGDGD